MSRIFHLRFTDTELPPSRYDAGPEIVRKFYLNIGLQGMSPHSPLLLDAGTASPETRPAEKLVTASRPREAVTNSSNSAKCSTTAHLFSWGCHVGLSIWAESVTASRVREAVTLKQSHSSKKAAPRGSGHKGKRRWV